jgi:hypothetical protein
MECKPNVRHFFGTFSIKTCCCWEKMSVLSNAISRQIRAHALSHIIQYLYLSLPCRFRLAASGGLRSAVALELVAGKVWALLDPLQRSWDPLPWRHGSTLHVLGATASHASAASHHACGREELPRCWADSEPVLKGRRNAP